MEELTVAKRLELQANQNWAISILRPFCEILKNGQCGMRIDLINGEDGQSGGIVMVLTAGSVPKFSIAYEGQEDQDVQS